MFVTNSVVSSLKTLSLDRYSSFFSVNHWQYGLWISTLDFTIRITETKKKTNDAMFVTNFDMFVINYSQVYHCTNINVLKTGLYASWTCNYVSVSFTTLAIFLNLTNGRNGKIIFWPYSGLKQNKGVLE